MPDYIYACDTCQTEHQRWHLMKQCETYVARCPGCHKKMHRVIQRVTCAVDAKGWEYLNGGRGEYISQLETVPNGKKSNYAYCRSQNELRDKAARIGMTVNKPQ